MDLQSVKTVGILGLGTMGHGIAQVFAMAGFQVRCYDAEADVRDIVLDRIRDNLSRMVAAGIIANEVIEETLGRITVCADESAAVQSTEFVTEAVAEELQVKQDLLARIESDVSPDTILASNSSSFMITQSSVKMIRPERAVITHWFNPPHILPVVEVVPGEKTSEETTTTTSHLLRRIGKKVIRINKEIPGFLVNRVQTAMYREIWDLLDRGVASAEDIDEAICGSMGLRLAAVGPLKINDFAGIDIVMQTYKVLVSDMRGNDEVPATIERLAAAGHYGTKTGRGIYEYTAEAIREDYAKRDQRYLALVKLLCGEPSKMADGMSE